jgi:hypothetical protein
MDNQLVKTEGSFGDAASFEHAQRVARALSESNLIPQTYQKNIPNTMIAMEMAHRIGASPIMVMQNLHIIQGKPSWSSPFLIASINSCGKYDSLKFNVTGKGDTLSCFAYTTDKGGNELVGPAVTMEMAKAEGWLSKTGSKWKTMPELMIRYRAAAFFSRLYCPEIGMGMHTVEEVQDFTTYQESPKVDKEVERVQILLSDCTTVQELEELKQHIPEGQMELFNQRVNELSNVIQ